MSRNLNRARKQAYIWEQSVLDRGHSTCKGPEARESECVAGVEQKAESSKKVRSGRPILWKPPAQKFWALKLLYVHKGK